MEKETFTRQAGGPVSYEIVVDLESFRIKERLPDKFTSKWIRCRCNSTDTDKVLKTSVKQLMDCHRSLIKTRSQLPNKLPVFLCMPFTVHPAHAAPETMSLQPSVQPSAAAKALSKETKLKTLLQEEKSSLKNHVAILMETVHDLSRDKTEQEVTQTQQLLSQLNQTVARQKIQMTVLCPVELQKTRSHLERV